MSVVDLGSQMAQAAGLVTVADLFRERARRSGASIALDEGGRMMTYAELSDRASRLAQMLSRLGLGRGDRVGILSENRHEYVEAVLACASLGAILACQNWRQSADELAHCIGLAEPRLMLVSERFSDRLDASRHDGKRILFGPEYEVLLGAEAGGDLASQAHPEDGLSILYTSGTTGLPKGAVISHRATIARGAMGVLDRNIIPGSTFVAWSPMFHMAALDNVVPTLLHGGKVILLDGFDPACLLEIAAREALGTLSLMPGTIAQVISLAREMRCVPKGIAAIGAMPDLIPPGEIAEITTLLRAPFRNTFGSTETGMAPASAGRIPIGVTPISFSKMQSSLCLVRLVDDDGCEVPDGTPGEVAFRGPSLFSGYWRNPEANAESFRDGWFHMGDVLRRNPDGTFDYVDRRKYLIKSGGENIYPAEIERVLLAHPLVADVAIVRKPDSRWGEVPVAFVAARTAELCADELIGACRAKIASYKVPREIHFITQAEMPRSLTGKIMRHLLEQRLTGLSD